MADSTQYQNELEQTFGRLPGIVQDALRPAYQPVDDAIKWVCGDPDALISAGRTYIQLGSTVKDTSTTVNNQVLGLEASWSDGPGQAFKRRMDEVCKALTAAGTSLADTEKVLTACAEAAVDAANCICDIVISVVEFIIADFVVSTALAAFTFGASEAAGLAAAIAKWMQATFKVEGVVQKIITVLQEVERVLETLSEIFRTLREIFLLLKELKQDASFLGKIGILAGKTAISKTTSAAWNALPGVPSLPQGGVHWGIQAGEDGKSVYDDVQQADQAGSTPAGG